MTTSTARYASLTRRAVLITGGASGIGAHMVREFTGQGARVTFLDIDTAAAAKLTAELPQARFIACDVTDIPALRAAIATAGEVEVLINNAARDDRHAIETVEPEYWRRTLALNLDHQFFATQAVLPAMRARGTGCVIMMGSISWMRARGGMVGYTTAKAAINGMTRTLARELGEHGIRVNSIVPGAINTERQATLWRTPELDRQILENQALKIPLDGSHVARMALFLASDEASGLTGQNFLVDAGMTLN
ncbi:MAG: SDR family oxidoreductase [Acetobacteraceae bacterium]|nr:SDR family oxidoreductase [Acetobacteraceae bacterium]